ncbi:MAG: NAD+ synthase, partial [Chloroflexaceae bacterium]|nr:NAD+ synthase [Chloroflexaceae bacterium]
MTLHMLVAQLRPTKANYEANLTTLQAVFAQLDTLTPRPDVLVLPETYLCGYFLEGGVRELARTAGQVAVDLNARYQAKLGSAAPPL